MGLLDTLLVLIYTPGWREVLWELTLKLPWVTKTEFLLTITIQSPAQVMRIKKNINLGIISWSNTKFSELPVTFYENCMVDSKENEKLDLEVKGFSVLPKNITHWPSLILDPDLLIQCPAHYISKPTGSTFSGEGRVIERRLIFWRQKFLIRT